MWVSPSLVYICYGEFTTVSVSTLAIPFTTSTCAFFTRLAPHPPWKEVKLPEKDEHDEDDQPEEEEQKEVKPVFRRRELQPPQVHFILL